MCTGELTEGVIKYEELRVYVRSEVPSVVRKGVERWKMYTVEEMGLVSREGKGRRTEVE